VANENTLTTAEYPPARRMLPHVDAPAISCPPEVVHRVENKSDPTINAQRPTFNRRMAF